MVNPDLSVSRFSGLRVAIVHYWFVGRAGGERVVEALAELLPQADLFCLLADRSELAPSLRDKHLTTSFLQKVPGARKLHRYLLLLQPLALEQFDFSGYDLVISSESGPAKGVITSSRTCHICYCHSPMRYIWEMYPQYKRAMNPLVGLVFTMVSHYMRLWDFASAQRVDYFIANSNYIASRIRKCYRRDSLVIYPPVNVRDASLAESQTERGDYYLAVGRLVDYKRFDLAVKACTQLGRTLRVIGDGPELKKLVRLAGPTVVFLGKVNDEEVLRNLAQCRALIFPGEEDFGIVPVEAQSFGKPVIAYGAGGVLETVRAYEMGKLEAEEATGLFFQEQSQGSLVKAILAFESIEDGFSAEFIRRHAMKFDSEVFDAKIAAFIDFAMEDFNRPRQLPGPSYD